MFFYSPFLTCIVLASFPFYIGDLGRRDAAVPPAPRREIQARRREPGVPGRERHRRRDAEGDGGRAADAAALGGAARRLRRGELPGRSASATTASQAVQLVSKLVTAAMLYFGAKLVIDGEPDGRRAGRLQHAGRPRQRAGAAAGADVAGFPSGAALGRRGWATSSTPRRSRPQSRRARRCRRSAGEVTFEHVSFRYRIDGPEVLHDVSFDVPAGPGRRHRRLLGLGQEHARQAGAAALRARERPRAGRRRRSRDGRYRLAAAADRRGAAGERAVQPLGPRQYRARRSRRCRWSA